MKPKLKSSNTQNEQDKDKMAVVPVENQLLNSDLLSAKSGSKLEEIGNPLSSTEFQPQDELVTKEVSRKRKRGGQPGNHNALQVGIPLGIWLSLSRKRRAKLEKTLENNPSEAAPAMREEQLRQLVRQIASQALEHYINEHLPAEDTIQLQASVKLELTLSEVHRYLLSQWFKLKYGRPIRNQAELKEALGQLLYQGLDLALAQQLSYYQGGNRGANGELF
jgi:hypothetical protein